MRSTLPFHLFGLLGGLGVGCSELLSSHCANLDGDNTCASRGGGSFCNVCSAEAEGCSDVMPSEGCHYPGLGGGSGGRDTTGDSGSDETDPDPSLDSGMTTESGGSCTESCGEPTPFCGERGECVGCNGMKDPNEACAALDPALPFCVNGTCEECTTTAPDACSGTTPICDADGNVCVRCSEHNQCGEAACNFYTGACLSANSVVHVGRGMAHTNITSAIASLGTSTEGTIIVHAGEYFEEVDLSGEKTFAFLASDINSPPRWIRPNFGGPYALTIGGGTTILLDGIVLTGSPKTDSISAERGVLVIGGSMWADRSRVVNFNGGGIVANNAVNVTLRNCFVDSDGSSGPSGFYAVRALSVSGGTTNVLYSTIISGTINTTALYCEGNSVVTVKNSIVAAKGQESNSAFDVNCPMADISFSVTESFMGGTENIIAEMPDFQDSDWFVNYSVGDYHLQNDGIDVMANVAHWEAGDPLTDIDGHSRPILDRTPDHAGADRPY